MVMLFTKRANDRPVLGNVLSCDFLPREGFPGSTETFPGSNEAEVFYAAVPTKAGTGYAERYDIDSLTADEWRWTIRATLIHEVKHITSYAERFARNAPALEETWLEEGTAMHAMELWTRTVFGNTWKGNADYRGTVYCDSHPATAECPDRPRVLVDAFYYLYSYLADVEALSPSVSDRDVDQIGTFYGSAWWLVRWAIDHYATSEADFLKALVQEPALTGIDNLTARTGRSWAQLLADWTLASAVDDLPGFTPARAELTEPSWNLRDVFLGAHTDLGPPSGRPAERQRFVEPFPLTPRPLAFGDFAAGAEGGITVMAGSAAYFELSGPQSAPQLLDLRGAAGGAPAPTLGLAIVRVQ
jgi:hypothetical protein